MLIPKKLVFVVVLRVCIYPIDPDRGKIFYLEAFAAVVADFIWVEVADLALHAVVAVLCLVQDTFDPIHFFTLPVIYPFFGESNKFFRFFYFS